MRVNHIFLIAATMIFLSCSPEAQKIELSNPGFGVTATSIDVVAEGVDLPVLLKTDDIIKGIQFTLLWDPTIGQVIKPVLTDMNPGFTLSASEGVRGEMKVLIFNMSGDELITSDPSIMTIPVRIIDSNAIDFTMTFKDVMFAGPGGAAYDIPVTHANLKVNR